MYSIIDGDSVLYASAYNVKNVEKAYDKFVDKITQLTTFSWDQTGDCTIFIEGKGNWRKDIFPQYKGHRKAGASVDPNRELRWELADYLIQNKLVIPAIGCETDDLVRRKAMNMRKRGQDYVVISADKDLAMTVGHHIRFNSIRWTMEEFSIDEEQADYNYFKQLLIGDMQDNIMSPKGLGKKTAEKLLNDTPRDQWRNAVENIYKEKCGSEWEHALYFTGSLIHIQRSQGDMFHWRDGGNWYDKGFEGIPSCYNYTDAQLGVGYE